MESLIDSSRHSPVFMLNRQRWRHRFVGIDTQSTESFALTSFWRIGSFQPGWIVLKEAVQNNFITILIGIGPVQDECWVGFEPLDILRSFRCEE